MSGEHPVEQPITAAMIYTRPDGDVWFQVGKDGVTRIEACTKPGMHSNIPYIRVWAGQRCLSEFCQHSILGIYFGPPE